MSDRYKELFEGRFTETVGRVELTLLEKLYYNFSPATYTERVILKKISKAVKLTGKDKPLRILDIGCGGGCAALSQYGQVTGVDVSEASISNAANVYHAAISLDATRGLPFEDNEFDICYSAEVLGHIADKDKNKFLKEIKRVLKPGAYAVISSETKGDNWYTRFLLRKNIYNACWVDPWGHIGLITPESTVKMISKYFKVLKQSKTSTWLLGVDNYMPLANYYPLSIFKIDSVRRATNMALYIPFKLSLTLSSLSSANDIVFLCKNEN